MNAGFLEAMKDLAEERGLAYDVLRDTVIAALESAYRKRHGAQGAVRIELDEARQAIRVVATREVVEHVRDPHLEIAHAHAIRLKPDAVIGDHIDVEVTPKDFGRIAAQTAKQVVVQRIREAEREAVFSEFAARRDETVTGEIQRRDDGNVFVTLGRVEALLPAREQIASERPYAIHRRLKLYILDVRRSARNAQVVVSRTHPGLVRRLFELEVPEVQEGIVEIKAVEREPGLRAKIAVVSHDERVDPVGACVGHRGARVQAVVDELAGEKIDIVRYSDDPKTYISNALNPAVVSQILIDEEARSALVIVPDDQLSLAIGKKGQNVRLAARLTGWRIDIVGMTEWQARRQSEPVVAEPEEVRVYDLAAELGITAKDAIDYLAELGIEATSHASIISGEQADQLRQVLQGGASAAAGTPDEAPEATEVPEAVPGGADDPADAVPGLDEAGEP